jgi:hypothetical protein
LPPFSSKEFLASLKDYEAHRKEIRKPLRTMGRKKLFAQLARLGEQRAIAAMDYSIAHGWTGVFEEKNGNGNGHSNGTNKPGEYQTATERRDADFRGYASVVTELRSRSSGAVDEVVRGKSHTSQ